MINADGKNHTGWAYMSDLGSIAMGFEDGFNLGDRDYNDVVFTISSGAPIDLGEIPIYGGGLLQNCRAGVIAQVDYVEYKCFQYALLSNPAGTTCSSFLSFPSGWSLMNTTDPMLAEVISQVGATWQQSVADDGCIIVLNSTSPIQGYGYTVTGAPCSLNNSPNRLLTQFGTSTSCFATPCGSRMLIKGQRVGSCSGVSSSYCNPSSGNTLVDTFPIVKIPGQNIFPTRFNVYTVPGAAPVTLPIATFVPNPIAGTLDTDIYFLLDASNNRGSNDLNLINLNMVTFVNTLTGSTYGFAPPNLGFGTIRYQSGTPSFFPHCAFNVDVAAVKSCIGTVSLPAASSTAQFRVVEGIDAAISTLNRQSAWRSYAYKIIVVISDSNPFVNGTAGLTRRMLDGNVVPVFYMPNPASSTNVNNMRSVFTQLPLSNLIFGPTTVKSNRLDAWFIEAQVPTLLRSTILNVTLARAYVTPDPVRDGFLDMEGSFSLFGATRPYGQVDRDITITFPDGYNAALLPSSPFLIPINIMGWGVSGVNVYSNRKPIVNDVALDTDENVPITFELPASDPDNNLLRVMFLTRSDASSPVSTISLRTGGTVVFGQWYNATQFVFSSTMYWNGAVSFTYRASDGCEISPTNSTLFITVRPVNQAPEADDFVVNVDENSQVDISFTGRVRDIDDAASTLSITIVTVPTATRGYLMDTPGGTGNRLNTGNFVLGTRRSIRFVPNQYISGNATFTYRVTDPGTLSSATRTVTVIVRNLRWAPTLSAPFTLIQAPDGASASVVVSIFDPDYADTESVGLRITARDNTASWGSHSVATNAGGSSLTRTAPASFPFTWAALEVLPPTGTGIRAINITWTSVGQRVTPDPTFTITAFDSDGSTSNSLTITMLVSANRPPFAVVLPGTVSTNEDTVLTTIHLSGNDLDDSQWSNLSLIITSAPTYGSLRFATASTAAAVRGTSVSAGTQYLFSTHASGSFAASGSDPRRSRFSVSYTPTTNYNGVDSFSYSFIDPTGSTSIPDTVTINILPTNDPPQTSNITIYTNQETLVTIRDFSGFDIDTGDVLRLVVTSLPEGELKSGSTVVTATMLPLNLGTSASWAVDYTPPYERYSEGDPLTSFKFKICDNSGTANNCSAESFVNIFVRFVNSAPTSDDVTVRTPRNTNASFILPALDRNFAKDPQEVLSARITSVGPAGDRSRNLGEFYRDAAMTLLVNVGDIIPFPRTLYFKPNLDAFSYPAGTTVASLKFQARDHEPLSSAEYTASAIIDFINQPPQYVGSLTFNADEDVPLQIALLQADLIVDDLLEERLIRDGGAVFASITSVPARGTLAVCFAVGNCTIIDSATARFPIPIPDELGRVVFTPEPDTWGNDYSSFTVNFTDSGKPFGPPRSAVYTLKLNVLPVNDPPVAEPVNFLEITSNDGNVILEDSFFIFTWRQTDKDDFPDKLNATIRFSKYTRAPWVAFDCFYDADIPNAPCEQGDPIANSETGFRSLLMPELVNTTTCTTAGLGYHFTDFSGCWAQFSIYFVPNPSASSLPFIQFAFVPRDDEPAEGDPLVSILSVLPVNDPPLIFAPSLVAPGAGLFEMDILDDSERPGADFAFTMPVGANKTNGIFVFDPDANYRGSIEKLTVEIIDGDGAFLPDAGLNCNQTNDFVWECLATLRSMNLNLKTSKFRVAVDTGYTEATVLWTINDMGFTSPEDANNPLQANATTRFVYTKLPEIADTPPPNNNLTIAVAAAAAAALLLLSLIIWRLRESFKAPDNAYFEVGLGSVAVAPVSPLYKAQFTDKTNPLYK
jgi:hypothetical protein